jgi:putative transposase
MSLSEVVVPFPSVYCEPAPVSGKDKELMRLIDEIHLEEPYLGSRGMKSALKIRVYKVGRIHVRTLMRKMGMEALYKKPRLSKPHPGHKVYPYLLRGLDITEANSVWFSDITYIPMAKGFCYLMAIMDWTSRKVLPWRLSNTLDTVALEEALMKYGKPDIFNTD